MTMLGRVLICCCWRSGRDGRSCASRPVGRPAEGAMARRRGKLDLALWTAVVFVCLAAVLAKFAWGPIAEALDRANTALPTRSPRPRPPTRRPRNLADYQRKLAEAKDEVRGILDQGRRDAEKLGRELLDKAKEEAAAEHVRAMQQIEAAADAAVRKLADQSAAMAVELAGKIVGASSSPPITPG